MSGGSWDYLYEKDAGAMLACQDHLKEMADRLASEGYDLEAQMTLELLRSCQLFKEKAYSILEKISPVWKAVEWWDSCDWGPEDLKQASEKFRSICSVKVD